MVDIEGYIIILCLNKKKKKTHPIRDYNIITFKF